MATINVNWSRLQEQGIEPHAITKLVQSWERAGFKVYGLAQDQKDLVVLQKMTEPAQPKMPANIYQLACFFLFGALASLAMTFVGWVWLMR